MRHVRTQSDNGLLVHHPASQFQLRAVSASDGTRHTTRALHSHSNHTTASPSCSSTPARRSPQVIGTTVLFRGTSDTEAPKHMPKPSTTNDDGATPKRNRVVVPVVREELQVRKRRVTRGTIRVRKIVRERVAVVDEPLLREEVVVERTPVDRPSTRPWHHGGMATRSCFQSLKKCS